MLVGRELDPGVLAPAEQGLDAGDVGNLVVHRPARTVGGLGEVVGAAATGQPEDGPAALGEGLDEGGKALWLHLVGRHALSILRVSP